MADSKKGPGNKVKVKDLKRKGKADSKIKTVLLSKAIKVVSGHNKNSGHRADNQTAVVVGRDRNLRKTRTSSRRNLNHRSVQPFALS
jgi:hypothetical protein